MAEKIRIVLDAGHGAGIDHNRGGVLFNEGDQNFKYSLSLKRALEKYENVEVLLTRNKITDNPKLEIRRTMYKNVNLFISLHTNAFSSEVRGAEIFALNSNIRTDLATSLVEITSKVLNTPNRGVKYDEYIVIKNNTAKLSYLIEHCFHTNYEDSKVYLDKQEELAKAQANVIAGFYNLKLKSSNINNANVNTKNDSKKIENKVLWRVVVGSYANYDNAKAQVELAKKNGFNAFIVPIGEEIDSKIEKTQQEKNTLAREIYLGINGWAGVYGKERYNKIESLGFNSEEIQNIINNL